MGNMYKFLTDLISARYYKNRKQASEKVDICFAMDKLTTEQFVQLEMLVNEFYPQDANEEVE